MSNMVCFKVRVCASVGTTRPDARSVDPLQRGPPLLEHDACARTRLQNLDLKLVARTGRHPSVQQAPQLLRRARRVVQLKLDLSAPT